MKKYSVILLCLSITMLGWAQPENNQAETTGCEISEIITLGMQDIETLKGESHKKGSFDGDTYWTATITLEDVAGEVHYSSMTIPSQYYVQYVVNPEADELMGPFEVEMLAAGYLTCLGSEYEEDKIEGSDHFTITLKHKEDSAFFLKMPHVDIKSEKWGDHYRVVVTVRFPDKG